MTSRINPDEIDWQNPTYQSVALLIRGTPNNRTGQRILFHEKDNGHPVSPGLCLPGGVASDGEEPLQTLYRELSEEFRGQIKSILLDAITNLEQGGHLEHLINYGHCPLQRGIVSRVTLYDANLDLVGKGGLLHTIASAYTRGPQQGRSILEFYEGKLPSGEPILLPSVVPYAEEFLDEKSARRYRYGFATGAVTTKLFEGDLRDQLSPGNSNPVAIPHDPKFAVHFYD